MKKMKKLMAVVLVLCMVMGLGITSKAAYPQLAQGVAKSVTIDTTNTVEVFQYTAATTGYHAFWSSGTVDAIGKLYGQDPLAYGPESYLDGDDDTGIWRNFKIIEYLNAGQTVYLSCYTYEGEEGTYTVTVDAAVEPEELDIDVYYYNNGYVGDSGFAEANFYPINSIPEEVVWTCETNDILEMDAEGNFDVVGYGTARITAESEGFITRTSVDFDPPVATSINIGIVGYQLNPEAWYQFTPTEAGVYIFSSMPASTVEYDPRATLYDEDYKEIASSDDICGDYHFKVVAKLEAGKTYYLHLQKYTENCKGILDVQKLSNPFVDVTGSDFFYTPVLWAKEVGVTTGKSATQFAPTDTCTRAEAVTFLWRVAGSPDYSEAYNPFVDISSSDYFYEAVLWAKDVGITTGKSATQFAPNDKCSRGEIVTFLYRADGEESISGLSNPFWDVTGNDFFYAPVLWAKDVGITTGKSATQFAPTDTCTRGEIVTFLYRYMNLY